ncbi:MAG: 2OG-Fe(II) oxygenase [Burkholderiales bacterium]|jgi:prolyl 4-hydroxylase|nr:2OG-Fe(II) oxygenase [Burkholderiales bacterium]
MVLDRHGQDPAALLDLGLRVVTGRDAPCSPVNGAAVIELAAERGHAQAQRYLSRLAAQGLGSRPGLAAAFDALERACAAGDETACAEQEFMRTQGLGSLENALGWLSRPCKSELLSDSPRVMTFRGLIAPGICSRLIELAIHRQGEAKVFDLESGGMRTDPMRTNRRAAFSPVDIELLFQLVRMRIGNITDTPVDTFEFPEVLHYCVGERYKPHVDYFHVAVPRFAEHVRAHGQRTKTALVYLNDDYDGGATTFLKLGFGFRGAVGDALVFHNVDEQGQGDMRTLHEGSPPVAGEKWLLSQWIRDRRQTFS